MIVTTGARGRAFSTVLTSTASSITLSSNVTKSASALNSLAISFAISLSSVWLIVANTPRSRRRRWSGATILESRRGRMPRLPRAHWPLPRSIERPPLSGRRRLRQAVLLAQPFLNNLLHGLPLFMRQLNLGRCRRSHYRRRNSPGRQGGPRAGCGLHHRGRHYRGRDHGRRRN